MSAILVTGGSSPLGQEIARHLYPEDDQPIVIQYHKQEERALQLTEELIKEGRRAVALFGDFSTPHGAKTFLNLYQDNFPSTKALVNIVGPWLEEVDIAKGRELFETSFFAPCQIIEALSSSIEKNAGAVVNIGVSGVEKGLGHSKTLYYFAAKSALLNSTRSFAKKMAKAGVRVNMVSPGVMESSKIKPKKKIPLGKETSEEEVARLVTYLLSEQNLTLTGQNIELDGGLSL